MSSSQTITVAQLNTYLKSLLDGDKILRDVFVKGELSNFKQHSPSGHLYFTLKDQDAAMRCVMFRGAAANLRFTPENGLAVVIRGNVSVFERDGTTQLYCVDMMPDGIGALSLAFAQMKEKLQQQGLFEASRKKPIPKMPAVIGVITSGTGAALQDILHILTRRFPAITVKLISVLVQGAGAAVQIAGAIRQMEGLGVDVLIVGRGGGSLEDLWPFNEEIVAQALYQSTIPTISAVGHETDFTIADLVADLRAPTPSAAAELATPQQADILLYLDSLSTQMAGQVADKWQNQNDLLARYGQQMGLAAFLQKIADEETKLFAQFSRMEHLATTKWRQEADRLRRESKTLEALCPYRIMERGYLIGQKADLVLTSVRQVEEGDSLTLRFGDGQAEVLVTSTKTTKKAGESDGETSEN